MNKSDCNECTCCELRLLLLNELRHSNLFSLLLVTPQVPATSTTHSLHARRRASSRCAHSKKSSFAMPNVRPHTLSAVVCSGVILSTSITASRSMSESSSDSACCSARTTSRRHVGPTPATLCLRHERNLPSLLFALAGGLRATSALGLS